MRRIISSSLLLLESPSSPFLFQFLSINFASPIFWQFFLYFSDFFFCWLEDY
ncbi:hypothetical protein AXX17_AT1G38730 [Arabidopsis thaliana]|uniref:Uncharacterized protein n=1 Tax=Arabidopsis thaliana TaxID=3702 RepID=A0A178WGA7_ARATH|nr:hypothetical protein AXX17_AT1G38730 [Arabidopsis thaliana]